jgi:Ca-activated chloride channel homolog
MFNGFGFTGGFNFEYPYVFLVIILFILCAKYCKAKNQAFYIPHIYIYKQTESLKSSLSSILKWITIIFAIIALASPIKEHDLINVKNNGIDMILSLDTSGSMRQFGFNPSKPQQNRWEVVQDIVGDFILSRKNDNIGIVVFGNSVMTASPLSYDKKAQKKIIDNLRIGIVGDKTALIDSIATSINILKNSKAKSKIIIAITDGDDTASTIPFNVVTKLAKKHSVKIYTIGIGMINPYLLEELSNANDGKTFTALSKNDLASVYEIINKLEKSDIEQNKVVLKEYYFFYPLMVSFLSLLLLVYIKNKRGDL